jgi:hypothetical protein
VVLQRKDGDVDGIRGGDVVKLTMQVQSSSSMWIINEASQSHPLTLGSAAKARVCA